MRQWVIFKKIFHISIVMRIFIVLLRIRIVLVWLRSNHIIYQALFIYLLLFNYLQKEIFFFSKYSENNYAHLQLMPLIIRQYFCHLVYIYIPI